MKKNNFLAKRQLQVRLQNIRPEECSRYNIIEKTLPVPVSSIPSELEDNTTSLNNLNESDINENSDNENLYNDSGIQEDYIVNHSLNSNKDQASTQKGKVKNYLRTEQKPGPKNKCLVK